MKIFSLKSFILWKSYMAFMLSAVKNFLRNWEDSFGFWFGPAWKMSLNSELQLMYGAMLTTCLDWPSVWNTVVHFFAPGSLSLKKKMNVFPITILTSAWLHMNSLTQSLSRETTMVLLSIAMSPTKKTYGLFHSWPLQTVWGWEGSEQEASYFMVGWQVCTLTTGPAVSNQAVFSKALLRSVNRKSRVLH